MYKGLQECWVAVKILTGLALAFALFNAGLLERQAKISTDKVAQSIVETADSTQNTMISVSGDVKDIKEMTNATLFQAEEVLHHADELLASEGKAQSAQLKRLDITLTQLQTTLKNVDESQQKIASAVTNELDALPSVTTQLQSTMKETQNTVAAAGKAIESLKTLEDNLEPTVQHINETTGNLDKMSASLNSVIQNATKPQPWYKKLWGYVYTPIKIVSIFAK